MNHPRSCRHTIRTLALAAPLCCLALSACNNAPSTTGNNTGGSGGTGGTNNNSAAELVRVSFDAQGGNFAVAEDDLGNEYAFRARETGGETTITEANVRAADGRVLKVSLDDEGRPVNFRMSNNTNADVSYLAGVANIRLTDADGMVEEGSAARLVADASAQEVPPTVQTNPTTKTLLLQSGLTSYKQLITQLLDDDQNPDSPLSDSEIAELADLIAALADQVDIEEVDADELVNATIDQTPALVEQLAGKTFVLFDAEGLCIEQTGAANRLSFDLNGVLQSEFDRNVVFPDFGLGETRDAGVTINYSTGGAVNLTPGGTDLTVLVKPVFTGTQVDEEGYLTIERRFEAESSYYIESFAGPTFAGATQLFDAALILGTLSDDGSILEFELQLVDLMDENPVRRVGVLRYHDQNAAPDDAIYTCDFVDKIEEGYSGVNCQTEAEVNEPYLVDYVFSREDEGRDLKFEWFVSEGLAFINGDPFQSAAEVLPAGEGLIEVSLIVSDLTDGDQGIFKQYSCQTIVGGLHDLPPDPTALTISCPVGMNIGDLGLFTADGSMLEELELTQWFVFGNRANYIDAPFDAETEMTFFQAGRFDVGFSGYDANGQEHLAFCEVLVGASTYDLCEINGYYGDGICDEFCNEPDDDCGADYFDLCEINGFYGDGYCDPYCPIEDPDCGGEFADLCDVSGFYGDGTCDFFCFNPDPDCDQYDVCEANGWYADGKCDFCSRPDPDCDQIVDFCADQNWYGDGECDNFCPQPDPDCQSFDICLALGWYGDGECDDFCRLPDTDCTGVTDLCAINNQYGDGVCDDDCEYPDVDCPDACGDSARYGDGVCDDDCLFPDPDCEVLDDCAAMGFYGDGICDAFCLEPDTDCETLGADVCEDNGWYGDGICDEFCLNPDPDCG